MESRLQLPEPRGGGLRGPDGLSQQSTPSGGILGLWEGILGLCGHPRSVWVS